MSKAILVVDTPNRCENCPCYTDDYKHWNTCRGLNKKVDTEENKPYWCPLKPMPQRKYEGNRWTEYYDVAGDYLKAQGYNKCIDEILGDTE